MMRLGFVQTQPVFGEPRRNVRRAEELLDACDADVAVLPELATSGYVFASTDEVASLAEPADGPSLSALGRWAARRGRVVVVGFPERAGDVVYNAAAVLAPEGVLGVYRKIHLFADEKRWFAPGDAPPLVVRRGELTLGVMICFDWRFPEVARSLAIRGAQVLCHPANLVFPYCQDAMVTRALENGVFAVTANRVGVEDRGGTRLEFTGRSQIVGPRAERLAAAPPKGECTAVVELDQERALDKQVTPANNLWRDRRPSLYVMEPEGDGSAQWDGPRLLEPEQRRVPPTGR